MKFIITILFVILSIGVDAQFTAMVGPIASSGSAPQFPYPYCNVNVTNDIEHITMLYFPDKGFDIKTTGCTGSVPLIDYTTADTLYVQRGEPLEVWFRGCTNGDYVNYFTLYIDLNGNDAFDEDERFDLGQISNSNGDDNEITNFTIPITSYINSFTRMRFMKKYNDWVSSACADIDYGNAQDFTIFIDSTLWVPPAPPLPLQPETAKYIDTLLAHSIDTSGVYLVNWLEWSLRGNDSTHPVNMWDSTVALYLYHGGTALSHSINIRNVEGMKITWHGSPTHDVNGVRGNGVNAYGNTGYYPNDIFAVGSSFGMGLSQNITQSSYGKVVMGLNKPYLAGTFQPGVQINYSILSIGGEGSGASNTCISPNSPVLPDNMYNFSANTALYIERSKGGYGLDTIWAVISDTVYRWGYCDEDVTTLGDFPITVLALSNDADGLTATNFSTPSLGDNPLYVNSSIIRNGKTSKEEAFHIIGLLKTFNNKLR